jgi:predicted HAD superfamily Cof-like phosphohydrolase
MSERDDITEQAFHSPTPPLGIGLTKEQIFDDSSDVWSVPLNRMQEQVREFHVAMGQPVASMPRALPQDRKAVRIELIREEFIDELIPALEADDMVEQADAAIDILYVTFGLLVEMGINAEVLFDEVQRSNMSKLAADGTPIIAGPNDPDGTFEGRVKKGPHYFRPRIQALLQSGVADQGVS